MIILQYSIRNAARIRAISLEPNTAGLTVIGGRNRQGKTSNLDLLAWALGGDRYKPTEPNRRGGDSAAEIDIITDNGLHIERKGKNGKLYVTDTRTGDKGNQTVLDKFVTPFALDLRQFRDAKGKDKADLLLKTLGVDMQLVSCQKAIDAAFAERTLVSRELRQKKGALAQAVKPGALPIDEPINVNSLVDQLQNANDVNTARRQLTQQANMLQQGIAHDDAEIERLEAMIARIRQSRGAKAAQLAQLPVPPSEVDTSILQSDIAQANALNAEYATVMGQRKEYERIVKEADAARRAAESADSAVEAARKAKLDLLGSVQMPDPDIGVTDDGELTYKGDTWDQIADSDELILCCKIVSRLNPECRFVLVDGLERLDDQSITDFDAWATAQGLQVIATRVTTDPDEATIIIEDGEILANKEP